MGVAAGAFAAHGLRETLSGPMLHVFETAVRYQMYHSFALFIVGFGIRQYDSTYLKFAGWAFIAGIILFSGSLYALALTGIGQLGVITPFGGVSFLAGWVFTAIAFLKRK